MTVFSFIFLSAARSFLSDTLMFCTFISTNVMMATVPAIVMAARRKRVEGLLGLAVWILAGTVATFLPEGWGMYTTADPENFSRPSFFVVGGACVVVAGWQVGVVARLPVSRSLPSGKRD